VNQRVRVGGFQRVRTSGWSGEDGQGKGSNAETEREQRHDRVPEVGASLAWWPASIPKPQAANSPCQQKLAAGDEHRNGVLHAWMLADSWPWVLLAPPDGGP
jgi:hypothetical protein